MQVAKNFNDVTRSMGLNLAYTADYKEIHQRVDRNGKTALINRLRAKGNSGKSFTDRTYVTRNGSEMTFSEMLKVGDNETAARVAQRVHSCMETYLDQFHAMQQELIHTVGYDQAMALLKHITDRKRK